VTARRGGSSSSDLVSAQVQTLTKTEWEEARATADEVHVVQRQPRMGGDE
jgi:hypothetical protein